MVAVDRQAIFPDTWSLAEEYGQQKERSRPEPRVLGSSCSAPVLSGEMPHRGTLRGPTQGPETPRSPEGTTEAATEARKEQPKLPHAMVMDIPNTTERISTSGQAGAGSRSYLGMALGRSECGPLLTNCM